MTALAKDRGVAQQVYGRICDGRNRSIRRSVTAQCAGGIDFETVGLGALCDGLVTQLDTAEAREMRALIAAWPQIAGNLATMSAPQTLLQGCLLIAADPAAAMMIRMQERALLTKCRAVATSVQRLRTVGR